MSKSISKLNPKWVKETLKYFQEFLEVTDFPHPRRNGTRGSEFAYPEWLIMFIAVLSVKCGVNTYLGIHRLTLQYWDIIAKDLDQPPISESQLRDRLKKISHYPGDPASFIFQIFPQDVLYYEGQC